MKMYQPISFSDLLCLQAPLISVILFHLVTLTLRGGHVFSSKQKSYGLIFSHTFQLVRQNVIWCEAISVERPVTTFR